MKKKYYLIYDNRISSFRFHALFLLSSLLCLLLPLLACLVLRPLLYCVVSFLVLCCLPLHSCVVLVVRVWGTLLVYFPP